MATLLIHSCRFGACATVLASLFLAGCASSDPASPNYDSALGAVRQTFSPPPEAPAAQFVADGANRSGDFPRFNPEPRRATTQMTPMERAQMEAEMAMLQARNANDPATEARYRERLAKLQAIARDHGSNTLARIEND